MNLIPGSWKPSAQLGAAILTGAFQPVASIDLLGHLEYDKVPHRKEPKQSPHFENLVTFGGHCILSLIQEHYDFGMRALKSILVRVLFSDCSGPYSILIIVALHQDSFAILWAKAGALRRIYGATREEQILALSALNDVAWQSNSEHVDPV